MTMEIHARNLREPVRTKFPVRRVIEEADTLAVAREFMGLPADVT
ncbi:hypothetical protein ACFQX4_23740 [Roseomonas sp. GCM10028921]